MRFSSFRRGVAIDIDPTTVNSIMLLINSALIMLNTVMNDARD